MDHVVCIVAVAPIRKESSHRSEIMTEILLGEFAWVLEETKDFIKIKCVYDGYEGWCQKSQLEKVSEMIDTNTFLIEEIGKIEVNDQLCRISCATPIFANRPVDFGRFHFDYKNSEARNAGTAIFSEDNIKSIAFKFLNTPYLWGGKSVFGIDCSGFTQQVFKLFNIKLERDAYQQAEQGEVVGFLQEANCGDLAFFDNEEGKIIHVGILLDNETIIHASGKVRIDKIDNAGIINSDTGERTHKLRIIKRYHP